MKVDLPRRYRDLQYVGKGLSSTVYRAYDTETKRQVAIKVFSGIRDSTVWHYFSNEASVLRRITEHRGHPNIVEYVESNFARNPYYITTCFVDGKSLDKHIDGQPQPAWFVVSVVEQIASALDYLHDGHPTLSPIVHRDVKPQNILIDNTYRAVLIDFSIASHQGFAVEEEKTLGTPAYMAPEQYLGHEVPASDQFALAAVAFQMLTGKPPLNNQTKKATKQQERWKEGDYSDIKRLLGDRRPQTTKVLIKALQVQPEQRYETCEEFANQLRQALQADGESVDRPKSAAVPNPTKRGDSQIAWAIFVLVMVLAAAILLVGLWGNRRVSEALAVSGTGEVKAPTSTLVPSVSGNQTLLLAGANPTATLTSQIVALPVPTATLQTSAQLIVLVEQREPLREAPSTDAKILTWMPPQTEVEHTGREQVVNARLTWYEVKYQNLIGWCRSIYCRPK